VTIDATAYLAFLMAMVRAGAWVAVAPPFNHHSIPVTVRAGIAAALALAIEPTLQHQLGSTVFDTPTLIGALVVQALAGIGLGLIVRILLMAVTSAGSMIDLFGGFTISAAYDPNLNAQSAVWGRFYELLTVVLLFAINGHLLLVRGFLASFDAIPLHAPAVGLMSKGMLDAVTAYFGAALEIAAPLLVVLFLAQVVLGLISRAAPAMNVLSISFPFMILLTILLAGVAIPMLPKAVDSLTHQGLRAMATLSH
jgi:flagellar biosynthetic protein FliR